LSVNMIEPSSTTTRATRKKSPIRNGILESRPLKENKIWGQLSFALASSWGAGELMKCCAGADGVVVTPRARLATVACRWRFAFMGQSRVGSHPFPRYRPPLGRPGYSGLLPSGWAYDVIIGYIR